MQGWGWSLMNYTENSKVTGRFGSACLCHGAQRKDHIRENLVTQKPTDLREDDTKEF